ncbi:MAG: glucan biosynthesis protein [Deltaproteobacteria bacterium]|nr:glucan biosynthesis protein [Deltaproteobacteria bacterium]
MSADRSATAPARRRRAAATTALVFLTLVTTPALATRAPKASPKASPPPTFGFDNVAGKAKQLAAEPFKAPPQVPEWLGKINYDQWRDIRFRTDQTLWREPAGPFQVQFFHPGLFYDRTVAVNVVTANKSKPLTFSPSQFDYGRNDFASRVPQSLGYAGLRLHAPFKTPKYYDEVIVFLGATYFRAVGRDQVFGLSARGIAIDTGLSSGEEFPYFREFWLETPTGKDPKSAVVYALLDSPSLTGAYKFTITPGEKTVVETQGRLYLRKAPQKIGFAPLTSMFFHGENTTRSFNDFRPEVHDSDGLLISSGNGEWLWRPLDNPVKLEISSFRTPALRGFGLVQRDRDFRSYEDLETRPDLRPSTWVVPSGDWGNGHVELIEIPTKSDANDNVVAMWVPDQQPKVGTPYDFAYTLSWFGEDAGLPPHGRVAATRRDDFEGTKRFVVDFAGKLLEDVPGDQILRGDVTVASGDDAAEIVDQHVVKNPVTGGWRLTFRLRPKTSGPIELRAYLDKASETLTETWSYLLRE